MMNILSFRPAAFLAVAVALIAEGAGAQVSLRMGVFASGAGQGFGDLATLRSLLAAGPVGTMLGDRYALHSGFWRGASAVTAIGPAHSDVPDAFGLEQNFPNPFNPVTTIRFSLAGTVDVNLAVYDILGRRVASLVNERKTAGVYEVRFDALGLSSGVYFYRLQAGDFARSMKLVVLK
jgi:hypothetical protein